MDFLPKFDNYIPDSIEKYNQDIFNMSGGYFHPITEVVKPVRLAIILNYGNPVSNQDVLNS